MSGTNGDWTCPGTKGDRPWDKPAFLFSYTVKSPFCPVCPWDGSLFVPGTIVRRVASEKCLCVLYLLIFSPARNCKESHNKFVGPYESLEVISEE